MPRYFFHIRSDEGFIRDLEGVQLDGDREAAAEAADAAREILSERVRKGEIVDGDRFEVHDENGTRVFSLPFRNVLRLH